MASLQNEVVVTGIGMVTPLGGDTGSSTRNWLRGLPALQTSPEELIGTKLEKAKVAILPELDPVERLGGGKMLKYMSPAALLGCIAAHEASGDADLARRFDPEKIGLFSGIGLAAANMLEVLPMIRNSVDQEGNFSCRLFGAQGLSSTNPLVSFRILPNMPACLISMIEGIKGPSFIFTPWEGQTAVALLEAWRAVTTKEIDCALVGASDTASHPSTFVFLRQMGLLRDDEYPASGAAYLVMERRETAVRDKWKPYARIVGIEVSPSPDPPFDPLASRLGRSFAAAPAILTALGCREGMEITLRGVDHLQYVAAVERF